jgi:putative endonuclease
MLLGRPQMYRPAVGESPGPPPLSAEVVSMRASDALGAYGERVAAAHLVDAGMSILERNWRCDIGEIDIVARDGTTLVVCEVKTRQGAGYGSPLEKVTAEKAERLRRLAARWIAERQVHPRDIRIDIVGVLRPARGRAQVDHVRGAIW